MKPNGFTPPARGLDADFALLQRTGERTNDLATTEPSKNERHSGADTATDQSKDITRGDGTLKSREQGRDIENGLTGLLKHSFL